MVPYHETLGAIKEERMSWGVWIFRFIPNSNNWNTTLIFMIYGTDIGEINATFGTYMAYIRQCLCWGGSKIGKTSLWNTWTNIKPFYFFSIIRLWIIIGQKIIWQVDFFLGDIETNL